MQRVLLGSTGIEVSRLAVGTGTDGYGRASDQTRIGQEAFNRLFRRALDHGITFWDLADQYGSHPFFREAMKGVDRSRIQITTKTTARTAEEARRDLPRFLEELGTDYLDIVLLHCMSSRDWVEERAGAMEVLSRAKQEGLIRALGVSCHNFGAFERAAETDWVEVNLCRLNYAGKHMDAEPERVLEVLERMHRRGVGIYAMKVMGAGSLKHDPRRAIRFVLDQPCVDALVIGVDDEEELDENVRLLREVAPAGAGERVTAGAA